MEFFSKSQTFLKDYLMNLPRFANVIYLIVAVHFSSCSSPENDSSFKNISYKGTILARSLATQCPSSTTRYMIKMPTTDIVAQGLNEAATTADLLVKCQANVKANCSARVGIAAITALNQQCAAAALNAVVPISTNQNPVVHAPAPLISSCSFKITKDGVAYYSRAMVDGTGIGQGCEAACKNAAIQAQILYNGYPKVPGVRANLTCGGRSYPSVPLI